MMNLSKEIKDSDNSKTGNNNHSAILIINVQKQLDMSITYSTQKSILQAKSIKNL